MFTPENEANLDALFRAYREACPAPEAGADFMPQLWRRIEARQRSSFVFGRLARGFVTAAAALSLGMAIYLSVPRNRAAAFYNESYVEALAGNATADNLDVELLHTDVFPSDTD